MRRIFVLLSVVLLCALPAQTLQAHPSLQVEPTLLVNAINQDYYPWVSIEVQNAPKGLGAEQFIIQLNDKILPVHSLQEEPREIDFTFIVDQSARMNELQTDASNRFTFMLQLLEQQLLELQALEPVGIARVSLLGFQDGVTDYAQNTRDLGSISNIIFDTVPDKPFRVASGSADDTTAVQDALELALTNFAKDTTVNERVIVLLASHSQAQSLNQATLSRLILEQEQLGAPVHAIVVGYTNDSAEADQNSYLHNIAKLFNTQVLTVQGNPQPQSYREIHQRFKDIIAQSSKYRLLFEVPKGLNGTAPLVLRAAGKSVSLNLELPENLANFELKVSPPSNNSVTVSIDVPSVGAKPQKVEYLLNQQVLAVSDDASTNFSHVIDFSNREFQQHFAPDSYRLSAVAWDADGNALVSYQPRDITIAYNPSVISPLLLAIIGALILALVLGIIGFMIFKRKSKKIIQAPTHPYPAPVNMPDNVEDPTQRYPGGMAPYPGAQPFTPVPGDDPTQAYRPNPLPTTGIPDTLPMNRTINPSVHNFEDDSEIPTQRIGAQADDSEIPTQRMGQSDNLTEKFKTKIRWILTVLEGEKDQREFTIDMSQQKRNYDIARYGGLQRADIELKNPTVSRNSHARLQFFDNIVKLTAEETLNETQIEAPDKTMQKVDPFNVVELKDGSTFWVGEVKLQLRREES